MVTITAAAFLFATAAPAFSQTVAAAHRTAAVNGLVAAILLARHAAVMRRNDVVLCKAPQSQVPVCRRGDVPWQEGVLVFVNLDGDEPPAVDAGEPVLFFREARPHVTIRANREAFVFRPFGRRATNGTLVVCDRRGADHARAVIVSPTGRPRTASTAPDGSPLTC